MNLSELSESQKKRIEQSFRQVPFFELVGIKLESVEPNLAMMSLEITDSLKQNDGVVHGGAIASLLDSVAAFAVIPLLEEGETTTTIDLTISYVRPLISGTARASARVLRQGSKIVVISAEVLDEAGNLAATALTTYLRLPKRQNS